MSDFLLCSLVTSYIFQTHSSMRRSTIERIVDTVEAELGTNADAGEIEALAVRKLIHLQHQGSPPDPTALYDSVAVDFPVHIRVDDCVGRLTSTVVSNAYDKIRRLCAALPQSIRNGLVKEQTAPASITLHVHGTAGLLHPLSRADAIEVCATMEQAGIDCGFDRIHLLSLDAGKSGSAVDYVPLVSGVLKSCPKSYVAIEMGSTNVGMRAAEALSTAEVLLAEGTDASTQARIELGCNLKNHLPVFNFQQSDLRVDVTIAIWPILEAMKDEIEPGMCYGDRFSLISVASQRAFARGTALLERLTSEIAGYDGRGRVGLSVDESRAGPESAEAWTGLPNTAGWDPSVASPAASLLRRGILAGCASLQATDIYADGLPLTHSIRNIIGFHKHISAAGLAGFLVSAFEPCIVGNRSRSLHLIGVDAAPDQTQTSIAGIPGHIPLVRSLSDWNESHFTRGGAIVPPLQDNRW